MATERFWPAVLLTGLVISTGCNSFESYLNSLPGGRLDEKNYQYAPGLTPTDPQAFKDKQIDADKHAAKQPEARRPGATSLDNASRPRDTRRSTNPDSEFDSRDADQPMEQ